MPRPRTSCKGWAIAEAEWCANCTRPQLKARCLLDAAAAGVEERDVAPAAAAAAAAVATTPSTLPLPPPPPGSRANAAAAGGLASGERARRVTQRYEPEKFWRPELSRIATDRREVQLQKKAQAAQERDQELESLKTAWYQQGTRYADEIIEQIRERLVCTAKELAAEKQARKKEAEAAAAAKRKAEAAKRQKTLHAFFSRPLDHEARPRAPPEQLGEGYTERNIISKTFAHHVTAIESRIIEVAGDDALKQLQLAAAVNKRMQNIRYIRDKDQEAWGYVRNSLKAFFEMLRDRFHGRYPNHVRAAQQAVCAAISNAVPPRKLHVVSEAMGISLDRLSEGRKHWSEWVCGDRESIMDLRAKVRDDKMNEEWISFAISIWTDNTRRSERAKDSIRNPNNK